MYNEKSTQIIRKIMLITYYEKHLIHHPPHITMRYATISCYVNHILIDRLIRQNINM